MSRGGVNASFFRLEIAPDVSIAHYNYGVLLSETGNTVEAVAEFRRTLELEPGHQAARENLVELESASTKKKP